MAEKGTGKKLGCAALVIALAAIWLIGGWGLYKAALKTPPAEEDKISSPFSFIPDEDEDEDS